MPIVVEEMLGHLVAHFELQVLLGQGLWIWKLCSKTFSDSEKKAVGIDWLYYLEWEHQTKAANGRGVESVNPWPREWDIIDNLNQKIASHTTDSWQVRELWVSRNLYATKKFNKESREVLCTYPVSENIYIRFLQNVQWALPTISTCSSTFIAKENQVLYFRKPSRIW